MSEVLQVLQTVLQGLGAVLIIGGSIFCVIGGIGMVRLPEFYSRCHSAGITDSAGAAGVLLGLALCADPIGAIKLFLVLAFVWMSSAVSTHALAKAAYSQGVRVENAQRVDWTIPPPAPDDLERITSHLPPAQLPVVESGKATTSATASELPDGDR